MIGDAAQLRPGGVGRRISSARRAVGLTQKQLADALGTSTWTVEGLESGALDPTRQLAAIAAVTRRPTHWFAPGGAAVEPRTRARGTALPHLGDTGRALVLGSVVLVVTIRVLTEVVAVLPRAANFVDLPVFLALTFAALTVPAGRSPGRAYLRLGLPALAFVALAVSSAVVNADRAAAAPVVVFVYGFLAPLAVYAATYRVWPPGNARSLSNTMVLLGVLQLVVVAGVDLPRFIDSGDPDQISGTFGTNAYQLVFLLLVVAALLAAIFTLEPERAVARIAPLLLLAFFIVIMLAQYRALLATTVLTTVVVGILLGRHLRGVVITVVAAIAFSLSFSYVSGHYPGLKLETTATTLTESPLSYASQRLEGARPVGRLYRDQDLVALIGTGPGTFSSRAWQTFAKAGSTSQSNVTGGYAQRLVGGVYTTDVSDKYVAPQLETGTLLEGSRAISSPFSSYLGLAAEVGLLGLALVVGVYLWALIRSGRLARQTIAAADGADSVPALALAATIGLLTLLQMAMLENWLEVTRLTFVVWAMLAVVSKEIDARAERTA